jgi:hypothetical protein
VGRIVLHGVGVYDAGLLLHVKGVLLGKDAGLVYLVLELLLVV